MHGVRACMHACAEFGDEELGNTWADIFPQHRMQHVLDKFRDLTNVVFVPFTMSGRILSKPSSWHHPYNQVGAWPTARINAYGQHA